MEVTSGERKKSGLAVNVCMCLESLVKNWAFGLHKFLGIDRNKELLFAIQNLSMIVLKPATNQANAQIIKNNQAVLAFAAAALELLHAYGMALLICLYTLI